MRHRPLLAHRLRRRRKDAGYSQRQLGDLSGIHYTTIARIETGEISDPEDQTLKALAKALGCEREELATSRTPPCDVKPSARPGSISRAMGEGMTAKRARKGAGR